MKKLSAFLLFSTLILLTGICVQAAGLQFTTNAKLPSALVNSLYTVNIGVTGGDGDYTFSAVKKLPDGMTLSPDGVFSGTPTKGGVTYGNLDFKVTDGEGNTARRVFRLSVTAQKVTFTIGNNIYDFDGLPHEVSSVTPSIADIKYEVTYDGETSQTNAGTYPINITVTSPGYMFKSMNKKFLYINKSDNVEISYSNLTFPYDGNPKTPTVSVTASTNSETFNMTSSSYKLYYEGLDVDYPSSTTPPTLPGRYRVSCVITDSNYDTPSDNSADFTIEHKTVNFTLSDQKTVYYKGDAWNRNYEPSDSGFTEYTVKYVKDNVEYDTPSDEGTYVVRITTDSDIYQIGTISPAVVTISLREVVFTISNQSKPYKGSGLSPDITNNFELEEGTDYTVSYKDSEGDDVEGKPVNAGSYTFEIALVPSSPYSMKAITDNTFTITKQTVKFTVETGLQYNGTQQTPDVTTEPEIDSSVYSITYNLSGEEPAAYVEESGTYTVNISFTGNNGNNYAISEDSTSEITVSDNPVNFTVSGTTEFTYGDGAAHVVTVTPDKSLTLGTDYDITYTKGTTVIKQSENANGPSDAGEYTVNVVLSEDSAYTLGSVTPATTITVKKKTLKFTAKDNVTSFDYTGSDITPEILVDPSDTASSLYSIVYHKGSDTADLTVLHDAGTYSVDITLIDSDNYQKSSDSVSTLTVSAVTVNFTVSGTTEFTYGDDVAHVVTVTPDKSLTFGDDYDITYTKGDNVIKQSENANGPSDAGEYAVNVVLSEGSAYTLGSVTPATTITVKKKTLKFTAKDNITSFDYTGSDITPEILVNPSDTASSLYSIVYHKGSDTADLTVLHDAGTYSVDITLIDSDNYQISSDSVSSLTVETEVNINFNLNLGNSPAAMIYLDSSHSENTEWQENVLTYFKENRKFSSDALPQNCSALISYPKILGYDIDADPYTVIVTDIDDFTDPGAVTTDGTDQTIYGGTPVAVADLPGLYKVTYTYNDSTAERYVAVVDGQIGDANGDGWVNAIDANFVYTHNNQAPATVREARIWDVNKDGMLDSNDSRAIRSRFIEELIPYYPWIND